MRVWNEPLVVSRRSRAAQTYLLHGLRVCSEIVVDAPTVRGPACDVAISWGTRRAISDAIPEGELLARLDDPDARSSLTALNDGLLWRLDGVCEFSFDRERREALVDLAPDQDDELASLLVGSFIAKLLALDGYCVLHASAVELDGRAIAFIGSSGAGKTTLAAMCANAGARIVTDDVLRVEPRGSVGWCYRGSPELRLRPGVTALAQALPSEQRRETLDERLAVRHPASELAELPLAAFVAPRPELLRTKFELERLRGSAALRELLASPRTLGWVGTAQARDALGVLAALAESVPVYHALLPNDWISRQELAAELLSDLDLAEQAASARPRRPHAPRGVVVW
jgi:hypothetical protein